MRAECTQPHRERAETIAEPPSPSGAATTAVFGRDLTEAKAVLGSSVAEHVRERIAQLARDTSTNT